jgi:hypothetical protein
MLDDLRQLAKCLTRPSAGRILYKLRNFLPVEIRSQRSRDETVRSGGRLKKEGCIPLPDIMSPGCGRVYIG